MSMTGDSKIMVSAMSFPWDSGERSKMRIKPDLKPIVTVGSTVDEASLVAESFWVTNSVRTSRVSWFHI